MSTPLGDMTQFPVTTQPTQAVPALGNTSVIIYNQDLTNPIYASYSRWFTPGAGDSIPIQSLTAGTLSARKAIYLAALVPVAPAIIAPEGTILQPSPAQVAASLSLSGIPLITSSVVVAQGTGAIIPKTPIPGNQILTIPASGQLTVTQIGFEMVLRVRYNVANGITSFYLITLNWYDAASGQLVDTDTMVSAAAAFNDGTTFATRIKGATKGNRLVVVLQDFDTGQDLNLNYVILQNSRVYPYDLDIEWIGATPSAIPGNTLPTNLLPDSHTMGIQINAALVNGTQDNILFPPAIGPMYLNVWEQGVSAANMAINGRLQPATYYGLGGAAYLFNDIMVTGSPNKYQLQFFQGGCPIRIGIANNGTINGSYNLVLTSGTK
jgi:hypothetical protein